MNDPDFVPVADAGDLWDGEMESYDLGGIDLLLVRVAGEYHAYHNSCPHQSASLVEGDLDGTTLTCRAHEWEFDLRTGAGINPRTAGLTRYPVQLIDGIVHVSPHPEPRRTQQTR